MRVLAVTPWFPSEQAPGSGVFNLRDVELLARDHEVTVLHLIDPALVSASERADAEPDASAPDAEAARAEEIAPGVRVIRIPFSTLHPVLLGRAAKRIRAEAKRAELLHTMAFPALLPAALARTGLPWVHTEHWSGLVTAAPSLRARLGGAVLRRGLAKPDRVVAVGRGLADAIDRYRGDPTALIANYVRCADEGTLPAVDPLDENGPIRIASVGGLIARKGPVETVEAVAELRRRGRDARLAWAGTGPLEAEVLRRAEQLGVADRVELLGHVAPEELPGVLLAANVFVLPTVGETFGVAIAEALGHGLPVVTSGSGGHLDFLPEQASRVVGRTGGEIAAAIDDLASDPERWSGERIAEYARARFSDDARREAYLRVYAEVR